ncbi:class I SAM-dependent methyltransferase [Halosquirtibacter xylanolyticus]|uniref:class I SAM-dependent methyltransferase n=1 Tax=Halosquirtibacter xylanolyticus TaxID=3374599 RepID=UPI00374A21EB|nr:class I SAM-dependent methyltransferase [Prolixibacteraceae bacterium]
MLEDQNNKETFWSQFATDFEKSNTYVVGEETQNEIFKWIGQLPDLKETLELGSGDGAYTQRLYPKTTKYHATDLSDQMLDQLQLRFNNQPDLSIEKINCLKTPYQNECFDTVVMANLYHIIPHPNMALMETYRILRPGGKLILISFTKYQMKFINKVGMIHRYMKTYKKQAPNARVLVPQEVHRDLNNANFEIEQSKLIGNDTHAICIIATKK